MGNGWALRGVCVEGVVDLSVKRCYLRTELRNVALEIGSGK